MKISTHPKIAIAQAVSAAIKQEFDVISEPRVVRQHKLQSFGTLTFVDYVVPCFELANTLNQNVHKVANAIADYIDKTSSLTQEHFTVEAIGGYINFQVCDKYVQEVLASIAKWYESPKFIGEEFGKCRFLILGPNALATSSLEIEDKAYFYIRDIYQELGSHTQGDYLLGDYSEESIEYIVDFLLRHREEENVPASEKIRLRRDVKSALTNGLDQSPSIGIENIRKNWLKAHEAMVNEFDDENSRLIFESDLAPMVQKFLDTLSSSFLPAVVCDEANRAVYYAKTDEFVSLRSASGVLYRAAYIFFMLSTALSESRRIGETLVVIAPQALHTYIYAVSDAVLSHQKAKQTIICFDPKVSQADILELQNAGVSLKKHFSGLSQVLAVLPDTALGSIVKRQQIISLIDLPLEMSIYAANHQFPALFDALSLSKEAVTALRA